MIARRYILTCAAAGSIFIACDIARSEGAVGHTENRQAVSTELPPDAREDLRRILAAPEFQPRQESKSFMHELWSRVKSAGGKALEAGLEWFRINTLPVIKDSWFGRGLKAIFHGIAWLVQSIFSLISFVGRPLQIVLIVIFSLVIGLLVSRLLRAFGESSDFTARVEEGTSRADRPSLEVLRTLLAEGRFRELLIGLRALLRVALEEKLRLGTSLTDRQLSRRAEECGESGALFAEVATIFERVFYADDVDALGAVSAVTDRYLREFDGSREGRA